MSRQVAPGDNTPVDRPRVVPFDPASTSLGPLETWPPSLRTTVNLCLASSFPLALSWGPDHVMVYNEGYRPICGGKHPRAMGQDFRECWASAWPAIGDAYTRARSGETAFLENQRMFLDRNGYLEETFFTFSFSPITDDHGEVCGVLNPCTETTVQMVGARRTRTLRDLGERTAKAETIVEVFTLAAQTLGDAAVDVPFILFYLLDGRGAANLVACAGMAPGTAASPYEILLGDRVSTAWPIAQVVRAGKAAQVHQLDARIGHISCGPYPEIPRIAMAMPLTLPGGDGPAAIMIAGVSPRLALDELYRGFLDMVAASVTAAAAHARAYEEQRHRAEELAAVDRSKTAFFRNVSHEFRTPLTLILGPVEDALAERHELPAAQGERLEIIHRNALRLMKLVNTMLDFSRLEAGRILACYEPTDLAMLTRDLACAFEPVIRRAGIVFTIDAPPLPEPIYVDPSMWEKLVLNLLSNAFKFTLEGEIVVELSWHGDHVELAVRDTGTGIARDELPHVFERFHQIPNARARTHEGSGIGLAFVHELARLHHGKVEVESQVGVGSLFRVSIPTGRVHVPTERRRRRDHISAPIGTGPFVGEASGWLAEDPPALARHVTGPISPARVLVVDDSADMRRYLYRVIGRHHTVECASDGQAALESARREPPDLVLTDVMMPRLDGFQLLEQLRADPRTRAVPVVMVSARAGEEARSEGLEAGADDYLVKPFSARELLARVKTQITLSRLRQRGDAERRALREANERLSATLATAAIGTYYWDFATGVVDHDPGVHRLFGFGPDEGAQVDQYTARIHPDDREAFLEALERSRRMGADFDLVYRCVLPDGTVRHLLDKGTAAFDDDGNPSYMTGAVIDLTARKKVELERDLLLVREREARQLAEAASRAKDEFLAMLGHELRNPLSPIVSALRLIELRGGQETHKEQTIISRQVDHLVRLVDDLLDVARITRGKIELRRAPVELADVIAKAVETASPLIEQRRHVLEVVVQRSGMVLDADGGRLVQVFTNLLTNAAKYTPEGGHVRLTAWRDDGQVVVRVADDGIGIAPELLPDVFDLFVQGARASDRAEGGLGLGLALVRNLVVMHGGTVTARSDGPGMGTELMVRLPAPPMELPVAPIPSLVPDRAASRNLRVLIVDDNEDAADALADYLRAGGHVVETAHDGQEALIKAPEFDADVAILDIGLPAMDGYELARRLRSQAGQRAPWMIALTGYGQEHDRARSRAAGLARHLVKPIEPNDVLALLDRAPPRGTGAEAQ